MFGISHLSFPFLALIFGLAALAVWIAGISLSNTTDALSTRFNLGEALGGLLLLAITTNLPEIAITVSAALHHDLGLAIGNILGGIAIQTLVLCLLDFRIPGKHPLTYQAASLVLVLEGILVVAVLIVAIMGTQMPRKVSFLHLAPQDLLIFFFWIGGVWLLSKARTDLPWQEKGDAPGGEQTEDMKRHKEEEEKKNQKAGIGKTVAIFLISSAVTLVAGFVLEETGTGIAGHIHLTGVLFGATVLAAATSLPEISTGLASIKMGDYQLAVSDIFGGNAFLPVLFLPATLLSGSSVLPQAKDTDIYLAGLGILLTAVYLYGLIFRPRRLFLRMGADSIVVLLLYGLGIAGLFTIAHAH